MHFRRLGKYWATKPNSCPCCGAAHSFNRHSGYWRWAIEYKLKARVWIPRLRCRACATTFSCMPEFLIPFRRHTVNSLTSGILKYLLVPWRSYIDAAYSGENGPDPATIFQVLSALLFRINVLVQEVQKKAIDAGMDLMHQTESRSGCPNAIKAKDLDKISRLNEAARCVRLSLKFFPGEFRSRLARFLIHQSHECGTRCLVMLSSQQTWQCGIF